MRKSSIIAGFTSQQYYTVPSEIDLITTNPTRKAIFDYLAQIGYDKFPEFILDILTKVDSHQAVDITDGQGDEKQDILTLVNNQRCLIQCKHTVDYSSHYNGDDLDLMVSACLRKNCRKAIFVTNSDLTPQGKKYITDGEYERGWPAKDDPISIEYWNGIKIWDKIKNNTDILNKWFSGLGQTHGLRNIKFDITIQQLPYIINANPSYDFGQVINILLKNKIIKADAGNLVYKAELKNGILLNIHKWFQFTSSLDIRYNLPRDSYDFINKPIYALSVEASIPGSSPKYSPAKIRIEIINYLFNRILGNLGSDKWWHVTSSQIKSFIFLHDIGEPRQLELASAQTFVKVFDQNIQYEKSYCSLDESIFEKEETDNKNEFVVDESTWTHKSTGIEVIQLFEIEIDPVSTYNYQINQLSLIEQIKSYSFRIVENIETRELMRIRRLLPTKWIAFELNENNILWGIPPSTLSSEEENITKIIELMGLKVLNVRDEDRDSLLGEIQTDLPPVRTMFVSDINDVTYPIFLQKRRFWLMKTIHLSQKIDMDLAINLLSFKYNYESSNGFDNLDESMISNSTELPNLLFDLFTFRGIRMLDIAILKNPITISLRFSQTGLAKSNEIASKCLLEFEEVLKELNVLFANYI